jgi:hypothetical protein
MPSRGGVPAPRSYKTSEIKSRILNVATPNIYQVRFAPPSAVQSFLTRRGVSYSQYGEDIELRCIQTTTPGTSFLTHSVSADYHGVVEEIPYRRAYENEIGMTFIVDNNYDTVAFFEGWVDYMSGLGTNASRQQYKDSKFVNYRMNYYDDYITNIYIVKFEKDISGSIRIDETRENKRALQYTLIDAYPKQINSMDLAYGPTEEFLRFNVTFGYSRYVRERLTVPQLATTDNVGADPSKPQTNNPQNKAELQEAIRQTGVLDLNRPYFGTSSPPPGLFPADRIDLA